jgi:hypothetical protein
MTHMPASRKLTRYHNVLTFAARFTLPLAWAGKGELMRSIKRSCPGVRCLFSLGRTPAQQNYASKQARETAWHERSRALAQD